MSGSLALSRRVQGARLSASDDDQTDDKFRSVRTHRWRGRITRRMIHTLDPGLVTWKTTGIA